jgi:hypothetical protein
VDQLRNEGAVKARLKIVFSNIPGHEKMLNLQRSNGEIEYQHKERRTTAAAK